MVFVFDFVGFAVLLAPTAVHSLADLPVVGTFPSFSLNGAWHASGQTRQIIEATREKGVDFLNPDGGPTVRATPVAYHGDLGECCQLCEASATCAASVWDGHHCTFRRPQDLKYRVTHQKGKTACLFNITSRALAINGTVPGDLVTDLQNSGIVENPLLDTNFQTQAGNWSGHTWTYSKRFVLPAELAAPTNALLIVFEGIKMGATVSFNQHILGNATNQHRRWVWPVDPALLSTASPDGSHVVEVAFDSSIATEGRYMDCSGGWDWSPYSFMRDVDGNPMWTRGIWKDVYLVGFPRATAAALTYAVPQVRYVGPHPDPTTPLHDGGDNPFEVDVCVYMHAAVAGVQGTVAVTGNWGDEQHMPVTLTQGENKICTKLHAATPRLWWPRGMGQQQLYNVTARFEPATSSGGSPVSASRRIGFRHVILVTGNDTNASWVAHAEAAKLEGNGKHTLMFRVNGAPFYAKGANMIPMEALEGRLRPGQHREHVNSAADAGMNMLRVRPSVSPDSKEKRTPFDMVFGAAVDAFRSLTSGMGGRRVSPGRMVRRVR